MQQEPQDLNPREREILHAIVGTYITTAEPVGSRSVVKRYDLQLSPATVRNVMADLEETGYLKQLHTSSGRVPTDKGYRYYVNYLMNVQELTLKERERIEREYAEKLDDADDVLRQTSHLLALISHQAGIAEPPNKAEALVKRIELMPIAPERLAVLMVDSFGRVRTMTAQLNQPLPTKDVPVLNLFLNEQLRDVPVDDIAVSLQNRLRSFLNDQRRLAEQALTVLSLMPAHRRAQLFLDGAAQLFEQPEFQDVDKARKVFGFLDEHDRIVGLLRTAAIETEGRLGNIVIGLEDGEDSVNGISVIASPYEVGGKPVGMIGVLGPRRMPYSRLTSIVSYTAGMVGRILTRLSN